MQAQQGHNQSRARLCIRYGYFTVLQVSMLQIYELKTYPFKKIKAMFNPTIYLGIES